MRQLQQEDGQADAFQPWVVRGRMPFESSNPQQEKNDQNDTDPDACEPGPSCLTGLDTDGRCERESGRTGLGAARAQNPAPKPERGTVARTCCW
jgi:hypothetical protein